MCCSMAVSGRYGVSCAEGEEQGRGVRIGIVLLRLGGFHSKQDSSVGMVYILLMINQILATLRSRVLLRPFLRLYQLTPQSFFCSSKDDKEKESGETVISLGEKDIQRMRNFLKGGDVHLGEAEEGQGQQFFQGEEVRLSLKLLQIDVIEQLKPFIVEYTTKLPESDKDPNELIRCKFFILLKYINLEGSILSKEISGLFKDISINVRHLDEETFTVFLRLIANDSKAITAFRNISPKVPLSDKPSHNNSELLSLLLMVYPQAKEDVYLHYHLKPTKDIQSQTKRMIYDPIHLIHVLSHYFYYDDVHKLIEDTMRATTVEDINVYPEELIKTDEDLKSRKAQALIYAVNHELQPIYSKYLSKQYFNFAQFQFKHSVNLLKSFTISQKATASQTSHLIMRECCIQLIQNLLGKKQAFISGEEDQLVENEQFKAITEILASYIRRKQPFLSKEHIISLIKSVFDGSSAWRANFDLYPVDELFAIIVSYKASKDLLIANQIEIDPKGIIFAAMLDSFRHVAGEAEPIQIFYVCLFAHQLNALSQIKSTAVLEGLKGFSAKKDLNAGMKEQLAKIVIALEAQVELQ